MNQKQKDALVKKAVKELGINRPIQAVRVKGNNLEIVLLYGDKIVYPIEAKEEKPAAKKPASSPVSRKKESKKNT